MNKVTPIDEEYFFNGSAIISQTDLKGTITYANRAFSEVSGYSVEELIGKPHNILRHPDMPKVVYEKMWSTSLKTCVKTGDTTGSTQRYCLLKTMMVKSLVILQQEKQLHAKIFKKMKRHTNACSKHKIKKVKIC